MDMYDLVVAKAAGGGPCLLRLTEEWSREGPEPSAEEDARLIADWLRQSLCGVTLVNLTDILYEEAGTQETRAFVRDLQREAKAFFARNRAKREAVTGEEAP